MPDLDRRRFLMAAAGLAVAAACGRGGDDSPEVRVTQPGGGGDGQRPLNLVVASYVHVAGIDERVTVAFLNEEGTGPLRPTSPVKLTIGGQEVASELHDDGIELPYLLMRHRFAQPGFATVQASYEDRVAEAALQVLDPAATMVPFPGKPMIPTPTPTVADPRGVKPVCTRQPACPLHDVSLDAALGERRPLAVLFATPALCQSQLCGPVLENLLAHRDAFAGRVRFLHVEIFKALERNAPTTDAVRAYHLEQEPFLFLAGADGVVRERLDNAYDRVEARQALERLVA